MYDYHIHTNFSDDSDTTMENMINAAVSNSIKEIAVTDHYDPDYPDKSMPFILDLPAYHSEMEKLSDFYSKDIRVVRGIEIGIQHGETTKKCYDTVAAYPYDFVIGSFHSAYGHTLDQEGYHCTRNVVSATVDYYKYVYECLREFDDFDVLGHINVIDRYVDFIPDKSSYMDIVEKILKLLIEKGKGLEINTSNFRYGLGDRTIPPRDVLSLYVKLGGEIITTGSDAHTAQDVGYMLDFAQEMILQAGHNYIATFKNRELIQQKIG